jgi:hypothetical protein
MLSQSITQFFLTLISGLSLAGFAAQTAIAQSQVPTMPRPASVPSPSPAASPSPTAASATLFQCIRSNSSGFATIARRGERVTSPMITWTSTLGGFTPEERCNIVSDRLTRAVEGVEEGKLKNLKLTYGRVNGLPVICYVSSNTEGCSNSNLLLTLRPEDRGQERTILQRLVTFSTQASGSPVQQSQQQDYAPLGEAVESQLSEPEVEPAPQPSNLPTPQTPVDNSI